MADASPPGSFVYCLWRPNQFKIGMTRDPDRRARQLRGRIVLLLPGGRDLERALHARFARYRFPDTEWFGPAREIWEWLDAQGVDPRRCA
jgi:hypothetical protein